METRIGKADDVLNQVRDYVHDEGRAGKGSDYVQDARREEAQGPSRSGRF
jgi:hypothetical protein